MGHALPPCYASRAACASRGAAARYAAPESRGSALAIATSIGFAITIPSIHLLTTLSAWSQLPWIYLALAIGPALGLQAMGRLTAEGA